MIDLSRHTVRSAADLPSPTADQILAYNSRSPEASAALTRTVGGVDSLTVAAAKIGMTAVPALWTRNTRTFVTPLGTDEALVGSTALNYQMPDNSWKPIDDGLIADTSAGFAWRNAADTYTAQFPASLADGPVKVSAAGDWIGYRLTGAGSTRGTVDGNTITYPNALPGLPCSCRPHPRASRKRWCWPA